MLSRTSFLRGAIAFFACTLAGTGIAFAATSTTTSGSPQCGMTTGISSAYWVCHSGREGKSSLDSCQTESTLRARAEKDCALECSADRTRCGLDKFVPGSECKSEQKRYLGAYIECQGGRVWKEAPEKASCRTPEEYDMIAASVCEKDCSETRKCGPASVVPRGECSSQCGAESCPQSYQEMKKQALTCEAVPGFMAVIESEGPCVTYKGCKERDGSKTPALSARCTSIESLLREITAKLQLNPTREDLLARQRELTAQLKECKQVSAPKEEMKDSPSARCKQLEREMIELTSGVKDDPKRLKEVTAQLKECKATPKPERKITPLNNTECKALRGAMDEVYALLQKSPDDEKLLVRLRELKGYLDSCPSTVSKEKELPSVSARCKQLEQELREVTSRLKEEPKSLELSKRLRELTAQLKECKQGSPPMAVPALSARCTEAATQLRIATAQLKLDPTKEDLIKRVRELTGIVAECKKMPSGSTSSAQPSLRATPVGTPVRTCREYKDEDCLVRMCQEKDGTVTKERTCTSAPTGR